MTRKMNSFKSLLFLTARQRKVCKRLLSGRGRLYRMAYAWTHNEDVADEVVQETMIKAIQRVDQLKNIDALDAWLFRVLFKCFIDICRKHREHVDIENFTYAEVSDILEVPIGTIMSRLNRARQALKQILEEENSKNKKATLRLVR